MAEPNIFDYATSELSQDAFICYLLAFGKEKYKDDFPQEYAQAHEFLHQCGVPVGEEITKIRRQDLHIDILVETTRSFLIIEDKIGTDEHNNQIINYVKSLLAANQSSISGKKIRVCYCKTSDYIGGYVTPCETLLPQENCRSLTALDLMNILQKYRSNNLIFLSFVQRIKSVDERVEKCDAGDISAWICEKWFRYLKNLFEKYNIVTGEKCGIHWVNNASGGFYAAFFNYRPYYNYGQTYRQIEIYCSESGTFRINLAYRFHSANWDRNETRKFREIGGIRELQKQITEPEYQPQNRIGASTAYKVKIYGSGKKSCCAINRKNTAEILAEIERFIAGTPQN